MRFVLSIVLGIILAGIWGFTAHAMGGSGFTVGIGAVLIGAVVLTLMNRKDSN